MPANPERMRPTEASSNPAVIAANEIVRLEAEKVAHEPNVGRAKYAVIFLMGIKK